MEVTFVTERRISKKLMAKLQKEFGFEITLDSEDDGDFEYFFGYPIESVGDDGCCEHDPMPYDQAVNCCGVLWREGISQFGIEGNGGWAMGMIMRKDFSQFAVPEKTKREWRRISRIFWNAATVPKKAK